MELLSDRRHRLKVWIGQELSVLGQESANTGDLLTDRVFQRHDGPCGVIYMAGRCTVRLPRYHNRIKLPYKWKQIGSDK